MPQLIVSLYSHYVLIAKYGIGFQRHKFCEDVCPHCCLITRRMLASSVSSSIKSEIVPSELQLEIHHLVKFRYLAQPEPLQVSEQIAGASCVLHQ